MAIKLINERYCPYVGEEVREFICDTEEDVASLPQCCSQSTALVCSTGDVYIVNASGQWVKFGG